MVPRNDTTSHWAQWKNSGHTYLSLSCDSAAVRNKVVCSTWPRSVTALLKLWSSISATRRMCHPIHVGLFREWKTTTLSRSWSVWVVIIRENGVMLRFMWKWGCTDLPYTFHPSIIGIYYMDTSIAMTRILAPEKSMYAKLLVQPNIISIFGWLSTQCGITISHFVKDKQIAFSPSFVDAVSSFYEWPRLLRVRHQSLVIPGGGGKKFRGITWLSGWTEGESVVVNRVQGGRL